MSEVTGRVNAETEGSETKGRGGFWRKVIIALAVVAALVAVAVVIILVVTVILVVKSWVPEDSMPASPHELASGLATVGRGF